MDNISHKRGYLLEDFRLFHLSDAPADKIDYHYHEFHKILLLISGSGGYTVEGNHYALNSGDMVLVGSRSVHRPEFDSTYERIIIYISPDFLRRSSSADSALDTLFSHNPVLRLPEKERKHIFSLAAALEQELSCQEFGRDILSSSLLLQLLVEMVRSSRKNTTQMPGPVLPNNPRILEIMEYINQHLGENLTIDSIAEKYFISKFHMMRSFRKETGMTIHSYILDQRLYAAKELIAQGMRATDACYHSGFHSYCSFTRAYSKRFGSTPTGRKAAEAPAEETYE